MAEPFEYLGEHRFHMTLECGECGTGEFTLADNSDAPIPVRVPPSLHGDEGQPVLHCRVCDADLHADGALRVALEYHVTLDGAFVRIDRGEIKPWDYGFSAEQAVKMAARVKRIEPDLVVAVTVCEAINPPVAA